MSKYENNRKHVLIKHNICNHEYLVSPSNFLRGKRCPKCNGGIAKAHEEFIQALDKKYNSEYEVLDIYERSSQKIKVKHKICGFEYDVLPYAILNMGNTCPWCSGHYQNTDRFKQWILENCGEEYKVIGEYVSAVKKVKMLHMKCGKEFEATPNHLKGGNRCSYCKSSKGEKIIEQYLINENINLKSQYRIKECRNKNPLPFDFAIFDSNDKLSFLIEFQGRQHYDEYILRKNRKYSNLAYIQTNDNIKKEYCLNNNIKLLTIPYWEMKNISEILTDYLKQFNNKQSA